jgi:dTDP-4-dehydrorhamnose 3,5-epimerase
LKLISSPLSGVKVLKPFIHQDHRGDFVKSFHVVQLQKHDISIEIKEEFFSYSKTNVIRGFHFQNPPHAHAKLIYCIKGRVLDVVMDLRKSSDTYGRCTGVELSDENHYIVYIPVGFAHAFASLEDHSCLVYKTDTVHVPSADDGILWSSVDFNWPIKNPDISIRDADFKKFSNFESPFL